MISEDKYSYIKTPVLRDTCVFLNKGPALGMQLEFILGTANYINLGLDKKTEICYLIGDYNVLFYYVRYIQYSLRLNYDGY